MALTILDGSNPTLDASQLSYEFEKARIKRATDKDVKKLYFDIEHKIKPLNFEYVSKNWYNRVMILSPERGAVHV